MQLQFQLLFSLFHQTELSVSYYLAKILKSESLVNAGCGLYPGMPVLSHKHKLRRRTKDFPK